MTDANSDLERSAERIPPVVLGDGITALGVVRSLGRAGLEPLLASRAGDFAGRSRWVRGRTLDLKESDDPHALLDGLRRVGVERGVLIPCSDLWSQAVSQLPDAERGRFPTSMPSVAAVGLLVDKGLFAETLDRFDVPHPTTLDASQVGDLDGLDLDGFFLKPRDSQRFSQLFRKKAIRFADRAEAVEGLQAMLDAGLTAVLQEYVPGPPTAHYFVDGFVDRTGVVRALFARRRIRMFPTDFGNSSMMVSVPLEEAAEAAQSLERLFAGIGYRGTFSAEFKRDPRDGAFKLLEVNSRPWWYIGFAAHCGVDVSVMIYRDALGLSVETVTGYEVGERCVLLPQDFRAYRAIRRTDGLSFLAWVRSWIGATPSIFQRRDPLPALGLPIFAVRRRRRRAPATAAQAPASTD
jgi:predicted ATP-grasp superfamily ATP-dependent carboligase